MLERPLHFGNNPWDMKRNSPSLENHQAEARNRIEGLVCFGFSRSDGLQVEYCRVAEVRCS